MSPGLSDVVAASLLVPRAHLKKKKKRPADGNGKRGFCFCFFFIKGRAAKGKMSSVRCERQQKGVGGWDSLARRLLVLIKLSNLDEATETER